MASISPGPPDLYRYCPVQPEIMELLFWRENQVGRVCWIRSDGFEDGQWGVVVRIQNVSCIAIRPIVWKEGKYQILDKKRVVQGELKLYLLANNFDQFLRQATNSPYFCPIE
jgi:hypothetical protein